MVHDLKIISLHDAKAECSCGFYFVRTGEATKEEIQIEHDKLRRRMTPEQQSKALKLLKDTHGVLETRHFIQGDDEYNDDEVIDLYNNIIKFLEEV